MKIEFLGAQGGVASGFNATSFLVNDDLLIDAGSVASTLAVERQALIKYIFLTHSHLDHIKDLAFLCDNCFVTREHTFEIFGHSTTIINLKNHLFNDAIWPDFSVLPNLENPAIRYNTFVPEDEVIVGKYKITPITVNHPGDAVGFLVEFEGKTILFSGDTSQTSRIWEFANQAKNLQAIVTEVSFPNSMIGVAKASYHHTAETFAEEYTKMPKGVPIYLTHLKPTYQDQIISEIRKLGIDGVNIIHHDGKILNF